MDRLDDTTFVEIMEQLIKNGPVEMTALFARMLEFAMQAERERFLNSGSVRLGEAARLQRGHLAQQ